MPPFIWLEAMEKTEQNSNTKKAGIRKLKLTNFRCYAMANMDIEPEAPVVLFGANGAGKTNLLEAISFLAPGKGLRHARFADVARHSSFMDEKITSMPLKWAVWAEVKTAGDMGDITIGTGCEPNALGENASRRAVLINGESSSQNELAEVFSAVWITPAMDRLFGGEIAPRRRFLDRLVQAYDATHTGRTNAYANAYKQWGKLLREGCRDTAWLSSLENTMAEYGVAIAAARNDLLARLDPYLRESWGGFPKADIALDGFLENKLLAMPALAVEDAFKEKLMASRFVYADGGTVAGAHNTDLVVHHENGMEAALCSTGQQKALLIAIVIAHARAMASEREEAAPLMLFDEAAAHLDKARREALFEVLLSLKGQSWFTGTDSTAFASMDGKAQFFNIENAEISSAVA